MHHLVFGQTHVSGTILDENNKPIPGVNILLKGTPQGTVSQINGHFELDVPEGSQVIIIRYDGYKGLDHPIDGNKNNINLKVLLEKDGWLHQRKSRILH